MYKLAYYITKNKTVSFVAGCIVTFSAYHFARSLGHFNLFLIGWVSLFILYFIKMMDTEAGWKLPAIFFILAAYSDLYYMLYLVGFIVLYFVFEYFQNNLQIKRSYPSDDVYKFILAIILFVGPYIGAMMYMKMFTTEFNVPGHDPAFYSNDLLSFFVPGQSTFLGHYFYNIWVHWSGFWESSVYLGLSVILLIIFTLFNNDLRKRKEVKFFMLVALIFGILSLGPYLHIGGRIFNSVKLPYLFFQKFVPLMSIQGVASRMAMMVYIALALISAISLNYVFKSKWRWKRIIIFIWFVILVFDYLPAKFDFQKVSIPDFYYTLVNVQDDFAIIDVSSEWSKVMYYKLFTRRSW